MIIEDILVELLDEGSSSYRPVKAEKIKENIYRIIVGQPYDTEDEKWEFEPGQMVEVEEREFEGEILMVATRAVD